MTREKVRVMKFGGTSVGDATRIRRAAEIVAAAAAKEGTVIAVVSAMGGVTNRLIEAAQASATGNRDSAVKIPETPRKQHHEAVEDLVSNNDRRLLLAFAIVRIIERITA